MRLPIQQRCYAGDVPEPLKPGHAIRLFTGSVIPDGADTVVMQEDTTEADNQVEISRPPKPGQHIRRRGEDTLAGAPLLAAGTQLEAAHVALLASQGLASVRVFGQLRVGILTTGDELVLPGQPRAAEQIYNSNGPMLAALARGMGALPVHVLHARDTEEDLLAAFKTLLADCDLVLSVGGVSVGERDLVKPALAALGGELSLWKVRMKPGKPVALAYIAGKPVVSLPGNPVSAYAVFAMLVTPLVRRMQGRETLFPPISQLPLRTEHHAPGRPRGIPAGAAPRRGRRQRRAGALRPSGFGSDQFVALVHRPGPPGGGRAGAGRRAGRLLRPASLAGVAFRRRQFFGRIDVHEGLGRVVEAGFDAAILACHKPTLQSPPLR